MYVYVYVCMYVCIMYVCMYVCMHVHCKNRSVLSTLICPNIHSPNIFSVCIGTNQCA